MREGGTLALGIAIGLVSCLLVVLYLDWLDWGGVQDKGLLGAIIGAVIAGVIGVIGQLFIIVQNNLLAESEAKLAERTRLEVLLGRMVRLISTFAQVRQHVESTDNFDNIVFSELAMLPKPLKINDLPGAFTSEDLTLPLALSDRKLFNLLNVLDSIVGNFVWAHREYESKVDVFIRELKSSGELKFVDGKFSGLGRVNVVSYYQLKDLNEHYVDSIYPGLVVSKRVSQILVEYLRNRHSVDMSFSDRISADEWQNLFESVDVGDFGDDL